MKEHGAMEFLWAVDDELFNPVDYKGKKQFIVATGDFDGNFDYGWGLMVVYIGVYTDRVNKEKDIHCVSMPILNVDDGIWRAVSKNFDNREDAQSLADAVAKEFINTFGYRLPSENELNEFLRPFGMYGGYEG
jgi:hypothetical protein